jgi:uncharacterized protein YxeA
MKSFIKEYIVLIVYVIIIISHSIIRWDSENYFHEQIYLTIGYNSCQLAFLFKIALK